MSMWCSLVYGCVLIHYKAVGMSTWCSLVYGCVLIHYKAVSMSNNVV